MRKKIFFTSLILLAVALAGFYIRAVLTAPRQALPPVSRVALDIPPSAPIATLASPSVLPGNTKERQGVKPEIQTVPVNPNATEHSTVRAGTMTVPLAVAPGTRLYDALVEARAAGTLSFTGKNYAGLGFFITDIGPLHAGGDLDLLYYVNGRQASVGVSAYVLKDGDVIEWKLE